MSMGSMVGGLKEEGTLVSLKLYVEAPLVGG
jgi:hypothetical protein